MLGEFDQGLSLYRASIEMNSIPVIWSAGVCERIRGWASRHPAALDVQLKAAHFLSFHGRFGEALGLITSLPEPFGEDPRAMKVAERIRAILAVVPTAVS